MEALGRAVGGQQQPLQAQAEAEGLRKLCIGTCKVESEAWTACAEAFPHLRKLMFVDTEVCVRVCCMCAWCIPSPHTLCLGAQSIA